MIENKHLKLPILILVANFLSSFCFAQVTETWVARYNGPGSIPDHNLDIAASMFVDGSGNVYVTGLSDNDETFFDLATIKYNASGIEQ